MGSYHILDGHRIRVNYKGNVATCGRCHSDKKSCKGEGLAKLCQENGGRHVPLIEHMRSLWAHIGFTPSNFELDSDFEEIDNENVVFHHGDRPISKEQETTRVKPKLSNESKQKLSGLKINNFPKEMTDKEVLEFIQEHVKPDMDTVNFEIDKSGPNATVRIFSGIDPDGIIAATDRIDFKVTRRKILERPLYCTPVRNITPTKPELSPNSTSGKLRKNTQEIQDAGNLHLYTPNSKIKGVVDKSDRKREANSPISDQPSLQKVK